MSRQRLVLTALAIAAIAAGPALAATGAATGSQAKSGLAGWRQISTTPADNLSDIGLARFGSSLQLVWVGNGSNDEETLDTRELSLTGAPSSSQFTVATWEDFNTFPQLLSLDGGRAISFAGLRSTTTSDPYTSGNQYLFTSSNGTSWTLSNQEMSYGMGAYGSYGSDVVSDAGTPVLVYTNSTANDVSVHSGTEPLGTAGTDATTTPESGADVYDAGDGIDAKSGDVWTVWNSLSGNQSTEGVSAQQILPTQGSRVHAPGTAIKSTGTYASASSNQRIDVASRPASAGGGLYAAFPIGYPDATKVELWKLGASKALSFKAGQDIDIADIAAGTDGRLWVFWFDSNDSVIKVARTNPAATELGAVCSVPTPDGSTAVSKLAGDGTAGPLSLFINAGSNGGKSQIYGKVVKPCLSVTVSPAKVRPGGRVTITVTDAGAAVRGATVDLLGTSSKTSMQGKATFTVGRSTSKGKKAVTVDESGYQDGHASLTVEAKKK